jgi:hypothetical protein
LPIAGAIGAGCVIRETPPAPPPTDAPIVYDAAPYSPPADQELVRYEPAPEPVVAEYEHDLGSYGHWVQTEYGRSWAPDNRPPDWQPYTVGYWQPTDQGWCWVPQGEESNWGMITYHYGRWYLNPSYGWVWVPGTVWAPAWVAWRQGDGYCGWTPLPPQCGEGVNVNVAVIDRYCPPTRYVYCDERYMAEPGGYRHYERNNVTIIRRTTNITNITYVDNRVINRGVPVRDVEARSGRRIEAVQLAHAESAADARRLHQEGRPVVYAPPVVQRAEREAQPRLQHAMTARPPRQGAAGKPYQAGGRQIEPNPYDAQQRQRAQEQQQANRQRQLDNQDRARQQAADRTKAQEQQRAQSQAQERARQQAAQQHQDALRQQRETQRQQTTEQQQAARQAQQQRQAERQQAARDAQERHAREAERQRSEQQRAPREGEQRQRNAPNQPGQPPQP